MTKTEHYQLPQWERTDQVKMSDFNDAFASIDQKCGSCRVVTGTYTGDGTYGQDHPTVLTFDSQPLFVAVQGETNSYFAVQGISIIASFDYVDNVMPKMTVTWPENGISWYSTHSAPVQLNTRGKTYYYAAILSL